MSAAKSARVWKRLSPPESLGFGDTAKHLLATTSKMASARALFLPKCVVKLVNLLLFRAVFSPSGCLSLPKGGIFGIEFAARIRGTA